LGVIKPKGQKQNSQNLLISPMPEGGDGNISCAFFVDEFLSSINQRQAFYWTWLWVARARPISYKKWELPTLRGYMGSSVVLFAVCVVHVLAIYFAIRVLWPKLHASLGCPFVFSPEFTSIFCLHLTCFFENRTSIQF
jgi:hypothetical protein